MLKTSLKIIVALALAFAAYLFWQANESQSVVPATLNATSSLSDEDVLTIAFGSCNRQSEPQDYWATIGSHAPDVWLWLGDNIYADRLGIDKLAGEYEKQKTNPLYASFAAGVDALYGIYDDHDYGQNDGGKENVNKATAKERLLEFLDVPADAAVRAHEGSYQSYLLGEGERSVKLILLDTRYFRDPTAKATKDDHRYGQNLTGDVLGEAQWAWLEAELSKNEAAAHLIGSSIQILPAEHGYEKWANFPVARTRLIALLNAVRPKRPLLLSGDRHLAEISELKSASNYPIYEITASGLTHSYEAADEPNSLRISPLVGKKNYGLLHYVWPSDGGPQLLAEVRGIDDDAVLASLALTSDLTAADKSILNATIHANQDMPNELKPCPKSPNCVSTQTDQADKKREPIAYTGSLADAKARLMTTINGIKRTKLETEADNYLHYTFKTWPIPFIDDVEFLFDDEAKLIHYRSASRVGQSDMGVNGRRMDKVVEAWKAAQ
jgi:alkaline phosphatase D